MSIDIASDTLVPIGDVPSHVPGRIHIATVWRWIQRGCRGVKLESVLVGGRRYTSQEAISRFVEATTAAGLPSDPKVRTPRQQQRQIAAANAELDRAGI